MSKAACLYNDTVVIVVVKVFVLRALKSKENRQELKDLRLDYYCNMDLEFGRKASSIQPRELTPGDAHFLPLAGD